jgi:Domain of unknown function (DUF4124)
MTSARHTTLLLGLLIPILPAVADPVYKSADAQGHVVDSDRATTPTSDVKVIQSDPAQAARAARQTRIFQAEENQRKQQQASDGRDKAHPLRRSSFERMCPRCESMVCTRTFNSCAISRVLLPRPIN